MWCVDWLQTATVCTKQTTGCPRWDCRVPDTLILPNISSLCSAWWQAGSAQHAAAVGCTHTGRWTGLDWMALPRPLPPKG